MQRNNKAGELTPHRDAHKVTTMHILDLDPRLRDPRLSVSDRKQEYLPWWTVSEVS